jgi:hypothetical protein
MQIEVNKTYRDEQSKCDITVIKLYPDGKAYVKISNRERPEVLKKSFVEKSISYQVTEKEG